MSLKFPHIILLFGVLAFVTIFLLHYMGFVTSTNEIYLRYLMIGIFITGSILIILQAFKKLNLFSKKFKPDYILLILSLVLLPISSIFDDLIGSYMTGIFISISFLYALLNQKLYPFNKVYIVLFLYAAMMLFGTIGTPKGFHFPEKSLSFLLLPLAYCCFSLPKEILLRIAHVFFRCIMLYLILCIIYWLFNFLYLDYSLFKWISSKLHIDSSNLNLVNWDEQIRLSRGTVFAAFYFVTSWAYFYHPSFISLVLFFGLISGLYLFHKKSDHQTVNKTELLLYSILCFIVIGLMESRIGLVGLCFILAVTGLYYSKLKTTHFKITVSICFILACASLFLFNDIFDGFLDDNVRRTDYTLAINYIKDHFWWGSGYAEQQAALLYQENIMKDILPSIHNMKYYTHNQFLGNMVQFGIWGLLVLFIMLIGLLRYAFKSRNYLLQMFLFVIILFMMIEEPLYGQKGVTIFSIFLTFFIAIGESKE